MLAHGILQFGSRDEELAAKTLGYTNRGVIIPNGISPEEYADLPQPGGCSRTIRN